jgi:hypothetical protein
MTGGRRVRRLGHDIGSKMDGRRRGWSRTVASREGTEVNMDFGERRKGIGALMMDSGGRAVERK